MRVDYVYRLDSDLTRTHFKPMRAQSYHSKAYRGKSVIYLTDSPAYASVFSFPWTDKDIDFGSHDENKTWVFDILRYGVFNRLIETDEVALYRFKYDPSVMKRIDTNTPEYIATTEIEVDDVTVYSSALECLLANNVTIKYRGEPLDVAAIRRRRARVERTLKRNKSLSL